MSEAVQSPGVTSFEQHPLRARILGELHARPTRPLNTPVRILHLGFSADPGQAEADRQSVAKACVERGLPGPNPQTRQFRIEFPGAGLIWERHSEFVTHSWEFAGDDMPAPFSPSPAALMQKIQMLPQPGPLLVAADLHMISGDADPDAVAAVFAPQQAVIAEANAGRALIATDFAPDTFGFVRLFIANRSAPPLSAGRLAQRVLEIETYRTLALLGLPEAQSLAPSIRRIETEMPRLLDAMTQATGVEQNRHLLDALTGLAAELEVGAAASLFRFGATRAYNDLVQSRLEALQETKLADYSDWSGFLTRRLQPAIRTCLNTEERQADLSRKLARAAELLRTRVNTEVESQNAELLKQMSDRAQVQLRLQQTVEGLSVAAITYYISNIFHHLFEGVKEAGLHVEPTIATAVMIPFIAAFVWWTVRRIRKRHSGE
jgi:uncharacterized membrane-anchored protein